MSIGGPWDCDPSWSPLMPVEDWPDYEREVLTGDRRLRLEWFGPYHEYEGHDAYSWATSFGYNGA